MPSGLYLPRYLIEGRKPVSVVFWYSQPLDHIYVPPVPEWYPIPHVLIDRGYIKVWCRTAHDVEVWSQKVREQERREKEIEDAKRELIEGPIRSALRADLVYRRDHAVDPKNRGAMQRAVETIDDQYKRALERQQRVSFQHVEGFEEGH